MSSSQNTWRILIVDDNPDIHRDIEKCLAGPAKPGALQALEREMFGSGASESAHPVYEIVSAHQGEQGVAACAQALREDRRFSAAFVDMRMPPGIDGLETIERLWKLDPGLQVILCTAFSDYSWKQISGRLGRRDDMLVLRKPFEQIEVQQMALALCEKRRLAIEAQKRVHELERHGQWTKGKSHDTFGPLGPWLATRDEIADPADLRLWLEVDGRRFQDGSTKTMVYRPAFLVSYLSRFMTLLPGDVISTGTPPGVGLGQKPPVYLRVGQTMRLGIDGLGEQRQRTVAAP